MIAMTSRDPHENPELPASGKRSDAGPARTRGHPGGMLHHLDDLRHPGRFELFVTRLREDFKLAMITMFGVIAVVVILPFAVFRFIHGDWVIALLDLGIVLAIILGPIMAWRFGWIERAGALMATIVTASALAAILGLDLSSMWTFSVLVANFLLAGSRLATLLSIILITLVVSHQPAFAGWIERWTFIAVSVQVALFSFIFAWRTNQRSEELAFLAENDPLTGLGNRRALQHDLTQLITGNRQNPGNNAVAMLDLDHFKRVNDESGHEAGDRILIELARLLERTTRESDRSYRFGGEEFVLLLRDMDRHSLRPKLEEIRNQVRENLAAADRVQTISIGATWLRPRDSVRACLGRADAALYQAKNNGRDRTEIE